MAVAIPLVMMAAGASTVYIAAAAVVLAATGVGGKINQAASKVFGKDLVNAANIAGSLYMGYSAMGADAGGGLGQAVDATGGLETALESTANTGLQAANPSDFGYQPDANIDGASALKAPALDPGADPSSFASDPTSRSVFDAAGGGQSQMANANAPQTSPDSLDQADQWGSSQQRFTTDSRDAGMLKNMKDLTATDQSATGRAMKWFNDLPDRTKASVIQAGGQFISGAASGYGRGQELEDSRNERRMYGSGSGLRTRARTGSVFTAAGG